MERTPCDRHVHRLKLVGRRIWQNWTLFRPEDFVGAEEHRTETNVVIYDKKEENTHQEQPVLDLIHRHRADCHCHPWGPTLATLARTRPAACSGCSGGVSEASKAASETPPEHPERCLGSVKGSFGTGAITRLLPRQSEMRGKAQHDEDKDKKRRSEVNILCRCLLVWKINEVRRYGNLISCG